MPTKRNKENDIAIPVASAPVRRSSIPTPRAKHGLKTSPNAATPEIETVAEVIAVENHHTPTESSIAALAYTYWAGRGYQGGSPEEDWLRAERELRARAAE
jgi:hypothetical protein